MARRVPSQSGQSSHAPPRRIEIQGDTKVPSFSRRALQTRWATAADAFAIARIAFATGHGPFPSNPELPGAVFDAATAAGTAYLLADFGGIVAGVAVLRGDDVEFWVPERFHELHVVETLLAAIDSWRAGGERLAS